MRPAFYWSAGFQTELRLIRVALPALQAQKFTVEAVDKIDQATELARKRVVLLGELRQTLLLNWKGRDLETGRSTSVDQTTL